MPRPGIWTEEEHDRFLAAIRRHPNGPWTRIADAVGTRSVRQVQTHTQKYYEKIMRRMRGPRKARNTWARNEHRIEDDILDFCKLMNGSRSSRNAATTTATSTPSKSPGSACPDKQTHTHRSTTSFTEWIGAGAALRLGDLGDAVVLDTSDDDDDPRCQLPSLEESLDFFLKSFEVDVEAIV